MGMDVYGRNPKQNKPLSEFPVLAKYKKMEAEDEDNGFQKKWKELDADHDLREQYWKEQTDYEEVNSGYYFRNNVWWWRPLWNYCYAVAEDLLENNLQVKEYEVDDNGETDYEKYRWVPAKYEDGHGNSGAGLDDKDAKELGNRLLEQIRIGGTVQYQASYEQYLDDLPDSDCGVCNGNNRGNKKKKDCKICKTTGKATNFNKNYPFDIDNVKQFAEFCIESGGFKIC